MAEDVSVTRLLAELQDGSRAALDALVPLVYEELLVVARRQRARWEGNHTLGTTALVHEAYLKLLKQERVAASSRAHFLAVASTAMRHILCNYARDQQARKRGGALERVGLTTGAALDAEEAAFSAEHAERLLALDAALHRLEQANPRWRQIVECRFFGGMTIEDTAAALDISVSTVKRDWSVAQAWLCREMARSVEPGD